MKRIAILGDPNSIWIQTYVNEVFREYVGQFDIYIFTDKTVESGNLSKLPQYINIIECVPGGLVRKLHADSLGYLFKMFMNFHKLVPFDYIHVHFVNKRKLSALRVFRKYYKKSIVTFWGSDLLRKSDSELCKMKKILNDAEYITVGSTQMKEFFIQKFDEINTEKLYVKRFGVNALNPIMRISESNNVIRSRLDIPFNKIVITIGYNGSQEQNHFEVLASLENFANEIKNKIYFILPMTYGLEDSYYHKIETYLTDKGYDFKILTEYMDLSAIASLCAITDVFIHAQKTDALSASIQEYLCAGKLLINPKWIVYEELKQKNVFYWEYTNYSEICDLVSKYVTYGVSSDEERMLADNKEIVYKLSSWDELKHEWIRIYS
ncbi:MAG: glycosyltransferase [Clostridiales bacterium]|nr:glycosyltransferase [Clostridiales bacterium]